MLDRKIVLTDPDSEKAADIPPAGEARVERQRSVNGTTMVSVPRLSGDVEGPSISVAWTRVSDRGDRNIYCSPSGRFGRRERLNLSRRNFRLPETPARQCAQRTSRADPVREHS